MKGAGAQRVWAEITDAAPSTIRYNALSGALTKAGIPNELRFIEIAAESFEETLRAADADGIQAIRLGGSLPELVPGLLTNIPSLQLTLKCADALIRDEQGKFWPRNFLYEAFQQMVAADLKDLDLNGAAFVVGATPEARAVVAALIKTGFRRINLTAINGERGARYLDDFRRAYFNVQFSFTPRNQITQLAGTHSIAVNTFPLKNDETGLAELVYFNFLKAGGVFVEVPLGQDDNPLLREARSIGTQVESSERLAALQDCGWAEFCFGTGIDVASFSDILAQEFEISAK